MSYEAKNLRKHWNDVRARDIFQAAHPIDRSGAWTIIELEGKPTKFYAEKGNIKTALRLTKEAVLQDLQKLRT